jgi:hypothetical protein
MIYSTVDKTWSSIVASNSNAKGYFGSITSVVADPRDNNHIFATTWRGGIYEFVNGKVKPSSLPIMNGNADAYQPAYGATYDREGENVWFFTGASTNAIHILKRDGSVQDLYFERLSNIEKADRIYIDAYNNKWINILRGKGESVFVFNELVNKPTEFNSSKPFEDQDGLAFFAAPRCFIEDKDGKMWIGTDAGPIVIENPANIFSSSSCRRIKVVQDGVVNYLLDGVQVTAIAVDGANRKWIATNGSGVFLVSEDGTNIINHFSTENSSLLSDVVNSLTLSESGELFIATDLGICSYQTDATEADAIGANPFENVYAFPNPVAENYNGVISIVGLEADSNIKITDISGNIVYETTSRGGMATWDGTNKNRQKVSTGIYLVYAANEDVSEAIATKIMVVNK